MSRAWTPDQNNAINAVGGSILVFAYDNRNRYVPAKRKIIRKTYF